MASMRRTESDVQSSLSLSGSQQTLDGVLNPSGQPGSSQRLSTMNASLNTAGGQKSDETRGFSVTCVYAVQATISAALLAAMLAVIVTSLDDITADQAEAMSKAELALIERRFASKMLTIEAASEDIDSRLEQAARREGLNISIVDDFSAFFNRTLFFRAISEVYQNRTLGYSFKLYRSNTSYGALEWWYDIQQFRLPVQQYLLAYPNSTTPTVTDAFRLRQPEDRGESWSNESVFESTEVHYSYNAFDVVYASVMNPLSWVQPRLWQSGDGSTYTFLTHIGRVQTFGDFQIASNVWLDLTDLMNADFGSTATMVAVDAPTGRILATNDLLDASRYLQPCRSRSITGVNRANKTVLPCETIQATQSRRVRDVVDALIAIRPRNPDETQFAVKNDGFDLAQYLLASRQLARKDIRIDVYWIIHVKDFHRTSDVSRRTMITVVVSSILMIIGVFVPLAFTYAGLVRPTRNVQRNLARLEAFDFDFVTESPSLYFETYEKPDGTIIKRRWFLIREVAAVYDSLLRVASMLARATPFIPQTFDAFEDDDTDEEPSLNATMQANTIEELGDGEVFRKRDGNGNGVAGAGNQRQLVLNMFMNDDVGDELESISTTPIAQSPSSGVQPAPAMDLEPQGSSERSGSQDPADPGSDPLTASTLRDRFSSNASEIPDMADRTSRHSSMHHTESSTSLLRSRSRSVLVAVQSGTRIAASRRSTNSSNSTSTSNTSIISPKNSSRTISDDASNNASPMAHGRVVSLPSERVSSPVAVSPPPSTQAGSSAGSSAPSAKPFRPRERSTAPSMVSQAAIGSGSCNDLQRMEVVVASYSLSEEMLEGMSLTAEDRRKLRDAFIHYAIDTVMQKKGWVIELEPTSILAIWWRVSMPETLACNAAVEFQNAIHAFVATLPTLKPHMPATASLADELRPEDIPAVVGIVSGTCAVGIFGTSTKQTLTIESHLAHRARIVCDAAAVNRAHILVSSEIADRAQNIGLFRLAEIVSFPHAAGRTGDMKNRNGETRKLYECLTTFRTNAMISDTWQMLFGADMFNGSAGSPPGSAAHPEDAESSASSNIAQLYQNGLQLFFDGQYTDALREWKSFLSFQNDKLANLKDLNVRILGINAGDSGTGNGDGDMTLSVQNANLSVSGERSSSSSVPPGYHGLPSRVFRLDTFVVHKQRVMQQCTGAVTCRNEMAKLHRNTFSSDTGKYTRRATVAGVHRVVLDQSISNESPLPEHLSDMAADFPQ